MDIDDIYVRKFNPSDKSLQLTEDFIEFPFPNQVQTVQKSLYMLYGKDKKIQILRSKGADFIQVNNMQAPIDKYLFQSNDKHYVTIKFAEGVPDSGGTSQTYWVTYVSPTATSQEGDRKENLTLNSSFNQKEVEGLILNKLNDEVKFFSFKVSLEHLKVNVETKSNKNLIPLTYTGTLQDFQKKEGKVLRIECQIVSKVKLQLDSEFKFEVELSQTIKSVLEKVSKTQLSISSQNFDVKKDGSEAIIPTETEIFALFEGQQQIRLFLTKKVTYEFLAFDEPLQKSLRQPINQAFIMNFVSFYKKQQTFTRLIKYQISQFQKQWRKLTIDCFKRGFEGRSAMNLLSLQQILAKTIQDYTLWNNKKLQKNYINQYLIERATSFGKILLCEMLRENFTLPTHTILGNQRLTKIIQESIFITSPGISVVSIEISPAKSKVAVGKSALLNELFFTTFVLQESRHQSMSSIPFIAHQAFRDEFSLNIIDVPKNVEPNEQQRLLLGANIILINSWQNQVVTVRKAEQLSKNFNCYVLILYRDRKNPTTKAVDFSFDLASQGKNVIQVFNIAENKGSTLNMNIIRYQVGRFILGVSKKLKEEDNNKIFQIFSGSRYNEGFSKYLSIMDKIKNNITSMKTQKGQPIHLLFRQILTFILGRSDFQDQQKFAYLFINSLKKMKAYAERPYLNMYLLKSTLQKKLDLFLSDKGKQEYVNFIKGSNEELGKIFKLSADQETLKTAQSAEENLRILKEKVQYVEKTVVPNIFSSEIAMRQLLIAKEEEQLDQVRNLKDVYVLLNRMEIKRGAPFQIIDGDNLDMPLESIKKSLSFVKGKVFVVSVLGPQSSGKSTVLNFLFGCNFRASEGRCTKGVYGSYYQVNPNQNIIGYNGLLIIDTQGIN